MENNIIFLAQNAMTIAPIISSGLIFIFIVTGIWRDEIIFTGTLVCMTIFFSIFNFGYIELAFKTATGWLVIASIYAIIFKKRNTKCN